MGAITRTSRGVDALLYNCVQVLPGNCERHRLGLAAAGGHLIAYRAKASYWRNVDPGCWERTVPAILWTGPERPRRGIRASFVGVALVVVVPELESRQSADGRVANQYRSNCLVVSVAPLYRSFAPIRDLPFRIAGTAAAVCGPSPRNRRGLLRRDRLSPGTTRPLLRLSWWCRNLGCR